MSDLIPFRHFRIKTCERALLTVYWIFRFTHVDCLISSCSKDGGMKHFFVTTYFILLATSHFELTNIVVNWLLKLEGLLTFYRCNFWLIYFGCVAVERISGLLLPLELIQTCVRRRRYKFFWFWSKRRRLNIILDEFALRPHNCGRSMSPL